MIQTVQLLNQEDQPVSASQESTSRHWAQFYITLACQLITDLVADAGGAG